VLGVTETANTFTDPPPGSGERIPIAIVSRNANEDLACGRLARVAAALTEQGFEVVHRFYDEAREGDFQAELLHCRAAMVWVNPVQDGRRRNRLDAILRRVAERGVVVSGRPDVIDILGVKAVLARTRDLGWSGDARFYDTPDRLRAELPDRLARGVRVLKPNRGNDGRGVLKIEMMGDGRVRATEALSRAERVLGLDELIEESCAAFDASDGFVDQAFQPRLGDGMIRCYFSADRVVGFGWQKVRALLDAEPSPPRTYSGPTDPRFQSLRSKVEEHWAPGVQTVLGLSPDRLPAIWDADFLFGPPDADGSDTFVLCEINASSVSPMPDEAAAQIAATMKARCAADRVEDARA
jgi:hypothetical protein